MRKKKLEKLAKEVEILIDLNAPIKEVTMAYEHYMDMTRANYISHRFRNYYQDKCFWRIIMENEKTWKQIISKAREEGKQLTLEQIQNDISTKTKR